MVVYQSLDVGFVLLPEDRIQLSFQANRAEGPPAVFNVQTTRAMLRSLCWDLVGVLEGSLSAEQINERRKKG